MFKKTSFLLNQWIEYLLFSLGFTMTLLVAVQVFCRYVLNQSLFWSEELARFLLVWLTFLGASCAYYRRANPGVDFLYVKMPFLLKKISSIMTHLVSMGLFFVMIVYGYQFAYFVRLQISPALQIPKWIVLSIIPISGAILMFHAATFLLEELKENSDDH
ncbi:MAG: C4-dicarboxylate ABC transporter permease [Desulfobacteraceae bacterium 4572_89]|nr:MAG: C4-dicarboxylate ABC transporter permease [Desulfobacteraceae bacterium 4572_89]